ncbi:MAG TPA: hypothetical protein VKY36_00855 [Moheibacter sp.]|nr:hypothetical protein [Moheibacter sp.]
MTQETFTIENSYEETIEIVKECITLINGKTIIINNREISWEIEYRKQIIKCKTLVSSNISKVKIKTTANHKNKNKSYERAVINKLHSSIRENQKTVLYILKEKVIKEDNSNKISFEKWILGILIGTIVISFLVVNLSDTPLEKYNCEIINTEVLKPYKKSINIRIQEKLNESQLREIANYLRKQNKEYENLFILYYLPGMTVGSGAWATTHYDPELTINVGSYFQSPENTYKSTYGEYSKQEIVSTNSTYKNSGKSENNNKDTFGIWIDDETLNERIFVRIRKGNNSEYAFEYIESVNSPPSDLANPLRKTTKNGKTIFIDTNPNHINLNQKFIIEGNGDLSVYDNFGFVTTYKKASY